MRRLIYFILLALSLGLYAQTQWHVRVAFYNAENLFDTLHDEGRNDYDFLPEGKYRWTTYRYWEKLHHLAQVMAAMGEGDSPPMLVGLCEVENDSCLYDLTHRSSLRLLGYDYAITHGPDQRGVETALLFQPYLFRLIESRGVRIPSVNHGLRPTRDILLCKGVVAGEDTVFVAVVHFPSRAGGTRAGTRNRRLAAQTLRHLVDSLSGCKLLVMGDFNAEPGDPIFKEFVPPLHTLVTKDKRRLRSEEGTYVFQHQWGYLDHILVSDALLQNVDAQKSPTFPSGTAYPFSRPFMLDGKGYPFRSFRGPIYQKGYSDHLPIMAPFSF